MAKRTARDREWLRTWVGLQLLDPPPGSAWTLPWTTAKALSAYASRTWSNLYPGDPPSPNMIGWFLSVHGVEQWDAVGAVSLWRLNDPDGKEKLRGGHYWVAVANHAAMHGGQVNGWRPQARRPSTGVGIPRSRWGNRSKPPEKLPDWV